MTADTSRIRSKTYHFLYADACNMCGSGVEKQAYLGRRLDKRQGLWPKSKPGITTAVFRCGECGLTYPNPMPIPENIAQHYDVEPEKYWVNGYFEVDPSYLQANIAAFTRLTGLSPRGASALDVGSGIGKAIVSLDRAGFNTSGIEPSYSFRKAAIERMGIREDRIKLASIEDASFPEETFDYIHFAAVLEHLADPAGALQRMTQWLKPGGVMYVEVPSSAFLLSRLVRLFYRFTGADYVINTCPMHVPYHLFEFGLESFNRHGQKAGYTVAFHEYYPCASYMPTFLIDPFNSIMRWTDTGMQLAVWLRKT